jgi:DNA modification methylase
VPDLAVEYRPIGELIPYARNARTHSEAQVAQIAGSIREFGFTNPVLVDGEAGIIAGHGRVLAARQLGMDRVPCIELAHLSPAQRRAYIIADNKLALNADWDPELLKLEMADLAEMQFDLSLTGFSEGELAGLLNTSEGLTDPDDAPEPPAHPVSELGDLWLLGRHRVLCGDCTVATDVERVLAGVQPHLMVTDPPYGVSYDPEWRSAAKFGDGLSHAGRASGKVTNDDRADWREAWALFPGDVAYIWHGGVHAGVVQASLEVCRFTVRSQIIWAKSQLVISRGHYHAQHEPCFYAVRDGATGHWTGDRKQTTLWQIDKNRKSETGHSTQKPVECMRRPIENNSSPGQAVYEPFSGSGTTIIAAEMSARAALAIEIAPAYVDVAVKRWQEFTGQQATLDGDGRNFDTVAAQRNSVVT